MLLDRIPTRIVQIYLHTALPGCEMLTLHPDSHCRSSDHLCRGVLCLIPSFDPHQIPFARLSVWWQAGIRRVSTYSFPEGATRKPAMLRREYQLECLSSVQINFVIMLRLWVHENACVLTNWYRAIVDKIISRFWFKKRWLSGKVCKYSANPFLTKSLG